MSKKLTLKEELEILRGEPIQVFTGDPMDIPCIETSDAERLCKHPIVSVSMITYNHEPYIRQAIEGVMMQKTDFEFELVIGEDCSTDKTREICFEYQKRYPDKIRILWCDHNLYRNPHPAGCNGARNRAHCRGEYIAFCEGDDYWIDPRKLQKQVDVMRKHPNVGICFSRVKQLLMATGEFVNPQLENPPVGVFDGKAFAWWNLERKQLSGHDLNILTVQTSGVLVRKNCYQKAISIHSDIARWRLRFSDTLLTQLVSTVADVFFLEGECASVYRIHPGGVTSINGHLITIDFACVFVPYFSIKQFGMTLKQVYRFWNNRIFESWENYIVSFPRGQRFPILRKLLKTKLRRIFLTPCNLPRLLVLNCNRTKRFRVAYWRYMNYVYPILTGNRCAMSSAIVMLRRKLSGSISY